MKRFALLALLALPLFAEEPSFLRFYNNDSLAARDVVLTCGGAEQTISIAPRKSVDVDDADCSDAHFKPANGITAVRVSSTTQWNAAPDDSCPASSLLVPPFGCTLGIATAAVSELIGATYSWSVEGATIIAGHGTSRITLQLGTADSVKVSVTVNNGLCSSTSNAVMKLTNPLAIVDFSGNSGSLAQPVVLSWEYDGQVTSQTLTGTDFQGTVQLSPKANSFSYTPSTDGPKVATLTAVSVPQTQPGPGSGNTGRRRPSKAQPVSATTCGNITATVNYTVGGNCNMPNVVISLPATVKPAQTFKAQVHISHTDTTPAIKWTITNGTPLGAIDREDIDIVAGQTGQVIVSAEVRIGETCVTSAKKRVDINAKCVDPTATVTSDGTDCHRSTIRAHFTGVAPWSGTWSDGVAFSSNAPDYVRQVVTGGSFTIRDFRDAICDGTVTGTATVTPPARVRLAMRGSTCSNGTIIATLEGKPPFTGSWSDDLSDFKTSDYTIEHKPVPGVPSYFIGFFRDANCTDENGWSASNELKIPDAPTADVVVDTWDTFSDCATQYQASIISVNAAADPPIHVKWSDGLIQDSEGTPARRYIFSEGRTGSQTYTVLEAHDAHCPIEITNPTHKIMFAEWPVVRHPDQDNFLCSGATSTATLEKTPQPGIPIIWKITNGEIVSGQGTPSIVWKAGAPGSEVTITCKLDYGYDRCMTTGTALPKPRVWGIPVPPQVNLFKSDINVGESTQFQLTFDGNAEAWSVGTDSGLEVGIPVCTSDPLVQYVCTYTYKNLTGAGVKTVNIDYISRCNQHYRKSFTITVH
jgi:hypothetical protein